MFCQVPGNPAVVLETSVFLLLVPLDSLWGRAASSGRDEGYLEVEGRKRMIGLFQSLRIGIPRLPPGEECSKSREVAFIEGASGSCRRGLHCFYLGDDHSSRCSKLDLNDVMNGGPLLLRPQRR
jgi:hypothetical protein